MPASSVDPIETVLIPAGPFMMGDENGRPDEQPVHRVSLGDFRIALLPVTNRQYAEFLSATGHEPPRFWDDPKFNRPIQPVVGVSWFSAVEYCEWLSTVHGMRSRLPTEAEWEKAVRAASKGLVGHGDKSRGVKKGGDSSKTPRGRLAADRSTATD